MKSFGMLVLFGVITIGCSSSDSGGITVNQLNPCATRGATYLFHCKTISGNCGEASDSIINTASDGSDTPMVCERAEQDGCTARDTNCKSTENGCTGTETFETTFTSDGSSASTTETLSISCDNGSKCYGTYQCTYTRQ